MTWPGQCHPGEEEERKKERNAKGLVGGDTIRKKKKSLSPMSNRGHWVEVGVKFLVVHVWQKGMSDSIARPTKALGMTQITAVGTERGEL